jgi:hypothetical protein
LTKQNGQFLKCGKLCDQRNLQETQKQTKQNKQTKNNQREKSAAKVSSVGKKKRIMAHGMNHSGLISGRR